MKNNEDVSHKFLMCDEAFLSVGFKVKYYDLNLLY